MRNLFFAKILPPSPPFPFPSLPFAKRPSAALEKKELKPLQEVPQRRWEAEKRREGEAKAAPVSRSGIFKKKLPPVLAFCVDFIRERKKGRKKEKEREVFISGEETLESWEKGKREGRPSTSDGGGFF